MSKNFLIGIFIVCCLIFMMVSVVFPSQALFYYHLLSNGKNIDNKIKVSDGFAITEVRGNFTFIIRNLGHQQEQITLVDQNNWSSNHDKANSNQQIENIPIDNPNCIAFKKLTDKKQFPDYTYYYPDLGVYLLVFTDLEHSQHDINTLCTAIESIVR